MTRSRSFAGSGATAGSDGGAADCASVRAGTMRKSNRMMGAKTRLRIVKRRREPRPAGSFIGFASPHYCCTPALAETTMACANVALPLRERSLEELMALACRQAFAVAAETPRSRVE